MATPSLSRRGLLAGVAASLAALPAQSAAPQGPRLLEARSGRAKIGLGGH